MSTTGSRHSGSDSRRTAARILGQWLGKGDFPDRLLEPVERDRPFVTELVLGVARWRRRLEWMGRRCAEREPDPDVWPFLLVGLYQIFQMDTVAGYAAVNETVSAVKRSRASRASGFVNSVLRRATREAAALREEADRQPLAVRESHPDILVDRWTARWGAEATAALCRWNNSRPDTVVHVNALRVTGADFMAALDQAGMKQGEPSLSEKGFLAMPRGWRVDQFPGYDKGWFTVQDPSTSMAVDLLDPQPGERVLDACAAPGGKTALLAERMHDEGVLVAGDRSQERLETVRENIKRLGLKNCRVADMDASNLPSIRMRTGQAGFDRVLLDVPCSNTGVLKRRPDARWRFSEDSLREVGQIQAAILEAASRCVKPGGLLVYSTCSLEPEENEERVRTWMAGRKGFVLEKEARLFPPESGTDGAYAAACRRRAGDS